MERVAGRLGRFAEHPFLEERADPGGAVVREDRHHAERCVVEPGKLVRLAQQGLCIVLVRLIDGAEEVLGHAVASRSSLHFRPICNR